MQMLLPLSTRKLCTLLLQFVLLLFREAIGSCSTGVMLLPAASVEEDDQFEECIKGSVPLIFALLSAFTSKQEVW